MNEEHAHLTTQGDEATEARIIAWVLGEASAFEAAELEALCEQMPEWRVFHRRMLALHDCLKEAHAPAVEGEWALPAEKRGKLDELLGQRETAEALRRKPRRKWWVNAAGIAAVLMLLVAIASLATGTMGKAGKMADARVMKEFQEIATYAKEAPQNQPRDFMEDVLTGKAPASSAPSTADLADPFAAPDVVQSDVLSRRGQEESTLTGSRFSSFSASAASSPAELAVPMPKVERADSSIAFSDGDHDATLADGRKNAVREELTGAGQKGGKDRGRLADEVAKTMNDVDEQARTRSLMGWEKAAPAPIPQAEQGLQSAATGLADDAEIAGVSRFPSEVAGGSADVRAKKTEGERLPGEANGRVADNLQVMEKHWHYQPSTPPLNAMRPPTEAMAPLMKQKEISLPPIQEITTADEPYSTFSLRVSDNAFRIAQAAMAQNQRPAADSVRVEEFYNAFDYGDPIPTMQEPVTASMEQSAHPILPQRNLLRIALRTASVGRSAGQPLRLTLLIDQSGSMNRGDRRAALLASVQELSQMLQEQDQISVIGFSRTPRLLAEKIPGNQTQRLLEIVRAVPSDGGTNLEEALKLGEVVAKRNQLPNAQNRLLLLTDGAANLGNADPGRLSEWVKQLRQKNLSFDIAGIGTDGLNDPLLVEIARHGNGRYYVMNDADQAKQQFAQQLAGAFRPVAENVKVQVRFNPQRVSRYQLIGFEKDRLRTEDFRNDKVDAAEMAAAEAGQALYQIELLPEGTGDIGEVSVRFRDVATQQMVERKWTIRHDATIPLFDRSTPTMQLAGLAMLSAQKLQGGDYAPMIRFSEMQEPRRRVRESFAQSPRVGELLEMIDQLQD